MKIQFYRHGGYYGDGNSSYTTVTSILDTTARSIVTKTETDDYGQNAENGNYEHNENTVSRDAVLIAPEVEGELITVLSPFIDLVTRYPHKNWFKMYSDKQRHFFNGRYNKAVKIVSNTDCDGFHYGDQIFVLPMMNAYLKITMGSNYNSQYDVRIQLVKGDN